MTAIRTIEVEIYKGKIQPILEQRQCKIVIYENHIEYIYDYDFKDIETGEPESLISAAVLPKSQISLDLTHVVHEDDPSGERIPVVHIKTPCTSERVYAGSMEKAEKVYSVIKRWLIS